MTINNHDKLRKYSMICPTRGERCTKLKQNIRKKNGGEQRDMLRMFNWILVASTSVYLICSNNMAHYHYTTYAMSELIYLYGGLLRRFVRPLFRRSKREEKSKVWNK